MEILGYLGAVCIGVVLGITGGGGSILTVPILVYVIHLNPIIATAYSLFIVGSSSAVGTIQNYRKGLVDVKSAVRFAIPSVLGVYLTRKFLVPEIPDPVFYFGSLQLSKATFLMVVFAIVMVWAAVAMLKNKKEQPVPKMDNRYGTIVQLFFVGVLIGLIGAGGGFLIVPALVKLARLTIKKAIATSLLVITINSLIGFIGDVQNTPIDWLFLGLFTGFSILGIFIGLYLQKFINENLLKKIFGIFILLMACIIFYKELFS